MTATSPKSAGRLSFGLAIQCAATLTAVLGLVCFIGWAAGLTTLAEIAPILTGVFLGSLAMALFRHDESETGMRPD